MTEEEKQHYFCHTHHNLFSQKNCHSCNRGMCYTCLHHNPTTCPDCLKTNFLTSDHYKNQKEISYILGIGLGATLIFHVYQWYSINNIYDTIHFLENLLVVLGISLSAISAYYMYSEVTLIKDVQKIPFIGSKLALLMIVISLVIGIPMLYLVYKIFIFLKVHFLSKKTTT